MTLLHLVSHLVIHLVICGGAQTVASFELRRRVYLVFEMQEYQKEKRKRVVLSVYECDAAFRFRQSQNF